MDPASSIVLAYESVRFIRESLKSLVGVSADVQANLRVQEALERVATLQDDLFNARDLLDRLQDENRSLKMTLAEVQDWKEASSRYSLVKTAGGGLVYYTPQFEDAPEHYACPVCFNNKVISVLQPPTSAYDGNGQCRTCDKHFALQVAARMHQEHY